MDYLLLAQAVETAEKGLGFLERINAGGVPLISLVIAALCGLAFYWQLRRNIKQHEDALTKAEAREAAKDVATKTRLSEQETLLREMLDRDRDALEAHQASMSAIEGFSRASRDQQATCEQSNQLIREMSRRIDDLEATTRRQFRDGP